jgi:hypothetical protein
MFDEPFPPQYLEKVSKNGTLHKGKFLTFNHHYSHYMQMFTIKNLGVESVLEIGPGENFTVNYMRNLGMQYDTMDIIEESNPTISGKLEDLDESQFKCTYDLVCAFQMLEHSPYDYFVPNINKMATIAKKYVFISLPYSCWGAKLSINLIFGQSKKGVSSLSLYFPLNKKNRKYRKEFKEEFPWAVHYWEIGRKGFPLRRIKSDIESVGLRIIKSFHSEFAYHYFILAEK